MMNTPSLFSQTNWIKVPVYSVKLVRETALNYYGSSITKEEEAVALIREHLKDVDREHFVVVLLSAKLDVIGIHTVAIGTLTACPVEIANVFKPAILANATSIIVGHNHPSGDPEPSPEDIAVTKRIRQAGTILEIVLIDHLIIGDGDRFTSLKHCC